MLGLGLGKRHTSQEGAGITVKVVSWDESERREIGGFWRPSEVDILKGSVWGLPISAHVFLPPLYFIIILIPHTETSSSIVSSELLLILALPSFYYNRTNST